MSENDDDIAVIPPYIPPEKPRHMTDKIPCNFRLDQLSKPGRWQVLSTWKDFGKKFDPDRARMMKERVQEQFSMTPEETETYLAKIRQSQRRPRENDVRLRRAEMRKATRAAEASAYRFLEKLIKRSIVYAYKHPPPLLMSPMLRAISDRVLEQLCDLHEVSIPKRGETERHSRYLLAIADWTAILTANIYYEVNTTERDEVARMQDADHCSDLDSDDEDPRVPACCAGDERKDRQERTLHVTKYSDGDDQLDIIAEEE